MKSGTNYYLQHSNTITLILLLTLWMLAGASIIWGSESLIGIPPSVPAWLRTAIYDRNGKLDPLTYLIVLNSIISFFLGAVNKLSVEHAFNVLLRGAVKFFFPYYNLIILWFPGFFLLFGGYCCKMNFGIAAVSCLCGLAFCSVYGFFMYTQISGENLNMLVLTYMHAQRRENTCPFTGTQLADNRTELHRFANYICQQWQNNSVLSLGWADGLDLERELILSMMEIIKCSSLPQKIPEGTVTLVNDIKACLQCSSNPFGNTCERSPCAWGLVYVNECVAYQDLYNAVQECSMLWDYLLQSNETHCQTKLTGKVLMAAIKYAPQTFMPLACGLLLHLRLSGPSIATELDESDCFSGYITPRLDFLVMIMDEYRNCFLRDAGKPPVEFAEAWGQLTWLAVAVLEWLFVLLWPSDDQLRKNIERFKMMLKSLISDRNLVDRLTKQADAYSRCAFVVLSFERPEFLNEDITRYGGSDKSISDKLRAGL